MTLTEFLQRAVDMATVGVTDMALRLSVETAAEPLLVTVFGEVGDELAANARTRTLLRRTLTLTVVNGSVALDQSVLTPFMAESVLYDPDDSTKLYSLTSWDELVRGVLDERLGHYAMEGESTLRVVEPGGEFDPAEGDDIELKLTVPCAPDVPALAADPIVARDEVVEILLTRMAAALRPMVTTKR